MITYLEENSSYCWEYCLNIDLSTQTTSVNCCEFLFPVPDDKVNDIHDILPADSQEFCSHLWKWTKTIWIEQYKTLDTLFLPWLNHSNWTIFDFGQVPKFT